jgi:tRNA-dihydrouridine synthase B
MRGLKGANLFRHRMNTLEDSRAQLAAVNAFFDEQAQWSDRLIYVDGNDESTENKSNNNNDGELLAA